MTTTKNNEHKKLNFSSEREQSQACLNSAEHEKNQGRKVLNVPNLRFKEFQGEWKRTIFKNVITLQRGSSPRPIIEYVTTSDDGVNWIKIGDMPHFGRIVTSTEEKITKEGAKKSRQVNKGDLILSNSMSYGLPYIMGIDGYIHDGWFVLKNFENTFDKDYLCNLLISSAIQNQYKRLAAGGVVQNISSDLVNSVSVSIPTMMEQKKISSLLNLIDERIATQNKIIEDLKMLKSAIIENVFDDKHSERLQLDNVGSYIRGLTYSSNDVVEHGGTLVMRSNNIVNGSLLDYNNNVVFVNKQMSAEQQLQNGDIVICMANGSSSLVGKSSFYDGNCHSPITVGAFCGIYRSKEPIVKWLFQTNKYRRYIWNSLQGGNGAIANLNGEDILNMSFSIPNAPIKDTCVKMLTSVDSALGNNMSLCALYTLQKQHLLRQMFI